MAPDSAGTALVQLTGAAGLLAGLFLLRWAIRELTETSGAALDERELQERDQALGAAYVTLLVCLGIVVLLPSAAAAWRWRELDEET